MATQTGRVVLHGRFRPGSRVSLVKVAGPHVLRAEGGELVGEAVVDADGWVRFDAQAGERYFIRGYVDGSPLEVRVRGSQAGVEDASAVTFQPPVQADRTKRNDGSFEDEHRGVAAHGIPDAQPTGEDVTKTKAPPPARSKTKTKEA